MEIQALTEKQKVIHGERQIRAINTIKGVLKSTGQHISLYVWGWGEEEGGSIGAGSGIEGKWPPLAHKFEELVPT